MKHFRQENKIVMVSGKQGCGKTMVMSAIGLAHVLKGEKIYANYHLNYPYIPVRNMKDLYDMKDGLFLADELWRWLFSRRAMKKDTIQIS